MDFCFLIISLLHFLVLVSFVYPINSLETSKHQLVNQTFQQDKEFYKMKKMIAAHLKKVNKPAVKTIQSPDGDIIDCVLTHEQLAFDHPLLKGQKPLDPPESLMEDNQMGNLSEIHQLWSLSGESCPEGTIPIRRITEQDILRVGSINKFGRKFINYSVHEYVVAVVDEEFYRGAKAVFSLWDPKVESPREFSLTQLWLGTKLPKVETIEVGWQVYQQLYGDNRPRLFIYWTADSYQHTGCYNLKCSGFVQISRSVVIGGTLGPMSVYNGNQYVIHLKIIQDERTGNWWLKYGAVIVGYWPYSLFKDLRREAYFAHFGGEIINLKLKGSHTTTQMGSGHFASQGFRKAAYIRNMQVAVLESGQSTWIDLPLINYRISNSNCYSIKSVIGKSWGDYMYYGGPGKNNRCI